MKALFKVRVARFEILHELQGVWRQEDFLELLERMEFGDSSGIDAGDLRDICSMSLQDLGPREAAALLLSYKLGQKLSKGQISNMSTEMLDEKLWEEDADMSLHEQLFNVGSLLWSAFPATFPEPDAVRVSLVIAAGNELAEETLSESLGESFLVRLLADGMDDGAVLRRLFDEQLAGRSFPEAESIVWTAQAEPGDGDTLVVDIISSGYWLDSLRTTKAYESHAYADSAKNS